MKKIVYRIIIGGIMLSVSGSIVYSFYSFLHNKYTFVLHFDQLFSQHACTEINAWLQSAYRLSSIQHVMKELEQQFACIKSVSYIYRPQGVYDIFIRCYVPHIVWNATHVITDHAILPHNYFACEYLKNLPYIVSQDSSAVISLKICKALLNISPTLFENYALIWHDQTKVILQHKKKQGCCIVADSASLVNTSKIDKSYNLYAKNEECAKKISGKRIFDIRFDNQILEYVMRGE